MQLRLQILAVMVLVTCPSLAEAKVHEKQRILQMCARQFGASVDTKENLFNVSEAFVLQLRFNHSRLLSELSVKPKYFFNETHPEWEEPTSFPLLSVSDFESLVTRLDALKSKGRLIKPSNGLGVITNSTSYYQEGYERALLKWGEVGTRGYAYNGIRFFSIHYYFGRKVTIGPKRRKQRTKKNHFRLHPAPWPFFQPHPFNPEIRLLRM